MSVAHWSRNHVAEGGADSLTGTPSDPLNICASWKPLNSAGLEALIYWNRPIELEATTTVWSLWASHGARPAGKGRVIIITGGFDPSYHKDLDLFLHHGATKHMPGMWGVRWASLGASNSNIWAVVAVTVQQRQGNSGSGRLGRKVRVTSCCKQSGLVKVPAEVKNIWNVAVQWLSRKQVQQERLACSTNPPVVSLHWNFCWPQPQRELCDGLELMKIIREMSDVIRHTQMQCIKCRKTEPKSSGTAANSMSYFKN